MMVLVPAVGVPHEELLQDTLKSIGVGGFALAAAFAFFWPKRHAGGVIKMHWLMVLPLALLVYALGSMQWSHAYLGGVESVRWGVFGMILFLGCNAFTQRSVTYLVWCIHLGAVLASLWAALQFWFDWSFFAQGPNPASTFINRNFFAEFVVCTLPFSALLLTRVRDKLSAFLLTFSLGFNIVALMMTGTRSALLGLLTLSLLLPGIALLYRRQWVSTGWRMPHGFGLAALLLATVASLGSIPTANSLLIREYGRNTAIDRAFSRTLSIAQSNEYSSGSFSIRARMWMSTARMMAAHPLAGVGAGAWEVQTPLYQEAGTQLETDYYAHNEPLQLVAEYGLVGWLFLSLLLAYLYRAARHTWRNPTRRGQREGPLRAFTLSSLFVMLLVSNAGFPWHMASTAALFALSLAVLAASDLRLQADKFVVRPERRWQARHAVVALCGTALLTGPAIYAAQQAIECEAKLVRASKMALTIAASGVPHDPGWVKDKAELLTLLQQGIAINPHYRKITPMAADAMASWGDWGNATWVWESVLASRPYVVGMLANAARGQFHAGRLQIAQGYLNRAQRIQPGATSLASLQVMLWSRTGQEQQAMQQAERLLREGFVDTDLVQVAYTLGLQQQPALAILALELGIKAWPNRAVDGWLKLGDIYSSAAANDPLKAKSAYNSAYQAATSPFKRQILSRIPPAFRPALD